MTEPSRRLNSWIAERIGARITAGARPRTAAAAVLSMALAVPLALAIPPAPASGAATASDHTSTLEARRVDRVTVTPDWFDCSAVIFGGLSADCGMVEVPLDYDEPKGATTSLAVLRTHATDPKRRIGTLFLNPGGPGGSGVGIAAVAGAFLPPALLERFDVVGFDPRGSNFSDNVRCWANLGEQASALSGLNVAFPWTAAEKKAYIASSVSLGKACSSTGRPLSASMSTAEVARDMDVLRRHFGDERLTYLGFSYGTQLGQVYANLFPDRVRALVLDGVVDPIAWTGTPSTRNTPVTMRLPSDRASDRATHEILRRCEKAGAQVCTLAGRGDPVELYDRVAETLRKGPQEITDDTGQPFLTLTYADFIANVVGLLYDPIGATLVPLVVEAVIDLLAPPGDAARPGAEAQYQRLSKRRATLQDRSDRTEARLRSMWGKRLTGYAFPYDNYLDAAVSVLCTDSQNPASASAWSDYAATADQQAPGFGPYWAWSSAPCASKTWTAQDEDAYRGPFTRRTAAPVLVVGNYWDPATNYDSAVKVNSLLPNSVLLSSDSWGHTAFGTSTCVVDAVSTYLLSVETPTAGTVCVGQDQPFESVPDPQASAQAAPGSEMLPPVTTPWPEPAG